MEKALKTIRTEQEKIIKILQKAGYKVDDFVTTTISLDDNNLRLLMQPQIIFSY